MRRLVNAQDRVGWTPLHIACCEGDVAVVQNLIDHGADVTIPATNGSTPLHVAARNHHSAVVRLLVAAGLELSGTDQVGATALHVVAEHIADVELMRYLLQSSPREEPGAESRNVDAVTSMSTSKLLTSRTAVLSMRDIAGWQPLHCTIHAGRWDVVQLMLAAGAQAVDMQNDDVRAGNNKANAPGALYLNALHLACYCGHEHLVWRLIQAGYESHARGPLGRTPLHYAALGPLQHTEPWLFSIQPLDPSRVIPPCAIRSKKLKREVEAAMSPFFMCVMACVQHGASLGVRLIRCTSLSISTYLQP